MNSPRTVNLDDAAAQLGIGRTLMRRLAREDALPPPLVLIRLGRRMLISQGSIDALLVSSNHPAEEHP